MIRRNLFIYGPYEMRDYELFKTKLLEVMPFTLFEKINLMFFHISIAWVDDLIIKFAKEYEIPIVKYNCFDDIKNEVTGSIIFHYPGCVETREMIGELKPILKNLKIIDI